MWRHRAVDAVGGRLASETDHPPSLAERALRRHTPEVGAVCGKAARPDLGGGREVTRVPTATRIGAPSFAASARGRFWHIAALGWWRLMSGARESRRCFNQRTFYLALARALATVWACHRPPRAVAIPRAFNASAMARSDLAPAR